MEYFIRFVDETSVEFVEPRLIGHRFETRNKGDGLGGSQDLQTTGTRYANRIGQLQQGFQNDKLAFIPCERCAS